MLSLQASARPRIMAHYDVSSPTIPLKSPSLQASARPHIMGNMVSALTAQKAFLNNFENVVNQRVDIQECYQKSLNFPSSKVDYNFGENIYMLPSDMNLNIKSETVGYNKKILVSDGTFSMRKMKRLILQSWQNKD